MRHRLREFWLEARARSAGRKAMGNDQSTFAAARGIVGATGASFSNAWDLLERDGDAYVRSMNRDRAIPPSLFVSDRDRVRLGETVPLSERCIEDHQNPDAIKVRDWDIEALDEIPGPIDLRDHDSGSNPVQKNLRTD